MCILQVETNNHYIHHVSWHSESERAAVTGSGDDVAIYDTVTGSLLLKVTPAARPSCVSFSPDGSRIIVGVSDGSARVYDTTTGEEIFSCRYQRGIVRTASFSRDGNFVLFSGVDKLYVSKLSQLGGSVTCESITSFKVGSTFIWESEFNCDSTLVLVTCSDRMVHILNAKTGNMVASIPQHKKSKVTSSTINQDGKSVATTGTDGVVVWDIIDQRKIFSFSRFRTTPNELSWDRSGKRLLVGFNDGSVRLLDIQDSRVVTLTRSGSINAAPVSSVVCSTVDDRVIVAYDSSSFVVLDF